MLSPVFFNTPQGSNTLDAIFKRRFTVSSEHGEKVAEIIEEVQKNGDSAIANYTDQFDCPGFSTGSIKVSENEIEQAYSQVDQNFVDLARRAISNIKEFHQRQLPSSWMITRDNGTILGQMVRPVDAAGLYVPGGMGGKTPLVSSVMMNAVPAVIAGVKRIVMATPPDSQSMVNAYLLVAAREAGVTEVYRMGSAWAVAALAYGTETVSPVDVIAGPGNIFVTLAKKMVSGMVGIDMIAGPSEILVIADADASAELAAADMLSQAEHDELASSILITTSEKLAYDVCMELDRLVAGLERSETARRSLENNGVVMVVKDLKEAVSISNKIAPEHLELLVAEPWSLIPGIRHAGAIFMGPFAPEPMGDYIAGPNHVLPTMGTARFSSALGVDTFLKRSSVISYTREAFDIDADDVMRLAEIEGLTAHRLSVDVRRKLGR